MEIIKVRIRGTRPMLMHSDRFANPLDPMTKAHKALTSKRTKTDEDYLKIARSEWRGALYYNDELGPVIPNHVMYQSIHDGARKSKLGKQFWPGMEIVEQDIKLLYDGPRDLDGLWNAGFYDCRSVVVSRARLMRYRPIFKKWAVEFTIAYDPGLVTFDQIKKAIQDAGRQCGIGDYHPRFGRYELEEIK